MERETMYLKTIESASAPREPYVSHSSYRVNHLDTTDIPGAQVGTTAWIKTGEMTNRPHFYDNGDVYGSKPAQLIPTTVNKPNNRHLRNDDIEFSRPLRNAFKTNRSVNPLNPNYELPKYTAPPTTPPKCLRDTLQVDDIEGTRSTPLYPKSKVRDVMNYDDIPGTKSASRTSKLRKSVRDTLDVRDINNDGVFKTKRVTDTMSPRYEYDRPSFADPETAQQWKIGEIRGNHVKEPPKTRQDRPLFSLRTDDIEGMKIVAGHPLPPTFPKEENRRQFRAINDLSDIEGSHSKGRFSTFARECGRVTNPLNPNYVPLDGGRRTPGSRGSLSSSRGSIPLTPPNRDQSNGSGSGSRSSSSANKRSSSRMAEQLRLDIELVRALRH